MHDNILPNGTVLPSGLLGKHDAEGAVAAFNRSFRDTKLKAGIVVKSYDSNDPDNQNGLCTEYDVITIEQFENKGSTSILYRNCLSTQTFGSVADFVEFTLRPKTKQIKKGSPTFGDQDGAIVLIQCLDGVGDKAVVVGYLIHPDRPTNITSIAPQLSGEYNGVNVAIANDGSCVLTFKGATDNLGVPTDPSQGNTVFQIKTDGSFEFNHSTIDINADRSGVLTINTKSDTNINVGGNTKIVTTGNTKIDTTGNTEIDTKGNTKIDTEGNTEIDTAGDTKVDTKGNTKILTSGMADIIAQGVTTIDGSIIKLGQNAVESVIKGNTFQEIFDTHQHAGNLGFPTSPPLVSMIPSLSEHTFTE